MRLIFAAAALTGVLVALPVAAQAPGVTAAPLDCVPEEENAVIEASIAPEVGGATTRLYFRWDEHGAMYWVDMVAAGAGNYWGIPAKPEPRNEQIEYYIAVVDPEGRVLGRSETQYVPVDESCAVDMTPRQVGHANNLTVGETVEAQEGRKVLGFLCDGVVTRINYQGIPRPDEICRGCVIPWWEKEEYLAPALLVPAATFILIESPPELRPTPPPISPDRP